MTQQGTPWGRIKESVDLPNGVTLGLIGGGGVVAIAPNNATQDKSMRLIDSHEAACWLLYSVKGDFPKHRRWTLRDTPATKTETLPPTE